MVSNEIAYSADGAGEGRNVAKKLVASLSAFVPASEVRSCGTASSRLLPMVLSSSTTCLNTCARSWVSRAMRRVAALRFGTGRTSCS